MSKMTCRFFILFASAAFVACGSRAFRLWDGQERAGEIVYPFAVVRERERVLPHMHYSLDVHSIDKERGTVDLSFYFVKEQGDSLLWVECVERVPLTLVDTALCRRWFSYDYAR